MHKLNQRPTPFFKSNNSSFFAQKSGIASLSGFKSRAGSITMDSAQEELSAFKHISGDLPMLDLASPHLANESYSLLLKKANQGAQSPTSSSGQMSAYRDHRQTSLGKDFLTRSKSSENEPKIIITPAMTDRFDQMELTSYSARHSGRRSSPFSPKKPGVGKKLSIYLRRKLTGDMSELDSVDSSKHQIEDPLTRKTIAATRYRPSRAESGRLLAIIARQAIAGRNPETSKIFHLALDKVNKDAIVKAKKDQYLNKRRRLMRFLKEIKSKVSHVTDPWKPDSFFVIIWKCFIMSVILMQCFFTTYIASFVPNEDLRFSNWIFLLDFIGDLFFILEILSLFQIGYYYHGELRCERSDIVAHYLATKFPIDVFTLLSLIGRFLAHTDWEYLILLTLIRLYKLKPMIAAVEDYFQFSREASSALRVIKLSGLVVVLAHLCACALYVLTKWEADDDNWMVSAGMIGKPEREIYVTSLYWSVTTMATVGFGDLAPTTMAERIFFVGIMIISSIIFGYILSTIGSLLLEISAYSSEAKEKIRILTKYMNEKGLHKDIQSKIRRYLEFYLDRENAAKIEGDYIMKMLSPNLQDEIVREVNAKTISDCYIFSSNFRRKFLYAVSKDLYERSFGPDETVYLRNESTDSSVYFITSGRIDLCYERCGISLQVLRKGACFGFTSFFSGKPRDCSAKSLEFTTVFELKREKFLEKLEYYPSEKETYFMIKDSILLYNNNQYINLKCYSCGSPEHNVSHCPTLHFTLDKEEVIQEYLIEEENFRKTFVRKNRGRISALSNLEFIQESASQIQIGHQAEVENEIDDEDEFGLGGGSYSSIDEIFDRRVYDPKPLDYCADTTHMKYLDLAQEGYRHTSIPTLNHIPGSKRMRQKVGEIETFMKNNYDVYHHNLNIDRVRNFEVYYPINNITRLIVELEQQRMEKIVQMRLGFKAKHLGPLLVKTFKMHEKKNNTMVPSSSPLTKLPSLKPKAIKRHSVNIPRRESVGSNPSDILLYNNSDTQASSNFSRFRHNSVIATSFGAPPYLLPPGEIKKRFDPLDFQQKINKTRENREKDLSTIREDNTEKPDKGSQSNLSIETPKVDHKFTFFDFRALPDTYSSKVESRNLSTAHKLESPTRSFLMSPPKSDVAPSIRLRVDSHMQTHTQTSVSSLEAEPSAGTSGIIDYSKLIQKFPNKRGRTYIDSSKFKGSIKGSEKDLATENEVGMSFPELLKNDTSKIFKVLLHDKLFATEENHKRAASEDNGKDIKRVIERYKLPEVFRKLKSNESDDVDPDSYPISLKTSNICSCKDALEHI